MIKNKPQNLRSKIFDPRNCASEYREQATHTGVFGVSTRRSGCNFVSQKRVRTAPLGLTWENFNACIALSVTKEQDGFIATNKYSLAQSYVALLCDALPPITKVICEGGEPIGFCMAGFDSESESDRGAATYSICRFMIDCRYQGKGFGKAAFELFLSYLLTFPQGKAELIELSYSPENTVAKRLYECFGLRETGEVQNGEFISVLKLQDSKVINKQASFSTEILL